MLIVDDSDPTLSGNRTAALPPAAAAFPRLAGIDTAAAIERLGDDVELYLELVQGFVDTQAAVPDELDAHVAAGRWSDAERVAHTAKSLAATVGANELAARASAIEEALRNGETGAPLVPMRAALGVESARVIGLLKVVVASGGAEPSVPAAPAEAAEARPGPASALPGVPAAGAGGRPTILAVDDAPANLTVLAGVLGDEYAVAVADSGAATLQYLARSTLPDLILLDVTMPDMDGYEVCRRLKAEPRLRDIPVIFVTARTEDEDEKRGLDIGGVDYITKPISAAIVRARVRNHLLIKRAQDLLRDQNTELERLVAERTREIVEVQDATIFALATLAETRDNETGNHIRRTQFYVKALAEALRRNPAYAAALSDAEIDKLFKSAPLHDIGKVGVPDAVLCKPGKLTDDEWALMRQHPAYGRDAILAAEAMLTGHHSFLRFAREIAYGHHEKWDGSGYPEGLAGEAIPLSARLMALADVYDALISKRVYKPPMAHVDAVTIILKGRGAHFDPAVVDAFLAVEGEFRVIAGRFSDD